METSTLLALAGRAGWSPALYDFFLAGVSRGEAMPEDERAADWRFLLPSGSGGRALVLGCGFGAIPAALARTYAMVYAADADGARAELLRLRALEQKLSNIQTVHAEEIARLPIPEGSLDLICLRECDWRFDHRGLPQLLSSLRLLLRPGGWLYFAAGNKWDFQRFFSRRPGTPFLRSLSGYGSLLKASGFERIEAYAPVPSPAGIPLFYVPLAEGGALRYFLSELAQLFDFVSPEVRRRFGGAYLLGRSGARAACLFGVERLAGAFLPGYSWLARRPEG